MVCWRSRWLCRSVVACWFVLSVAAPAAAQPARSFQELNASHRIGPGESIMVRDTSGHEFKGVLRDLGTGALTLDIGRNVPRTFVSSDVTRIRRPGGHAGVWGALAGAAGGALAAWAAASKYGENETGGVCSICFLQWGAVAIPAGAAGGALIGLGIERDRREVLYLATAARSRAAWAWNARSAGLQVSVRF